MESVNEKEFHFPSSGLPSRLILTYTCEDEDTRCTTRGTCDDISNFKDMIFESHVVNQS